MRRLRPDPVEPPRLERDGSRCVGRFRAMGGPCEVLVDTPRLRDASALVDLAAAEAWRIERKYSRYRDDSVIARLHRSGGAPIGVDDETAMLLDYAAMCHEMSEGRFDVTSGVLRRAWTFDGRSAVPAPDDVATLLERVGWDKVGWHERVLTLPEGMELDLGGIGKEYAVDRARVRIAEASAIPVVVNFGGDLCVSGPHADGTPWAVGIDDPERTGEAARATLALASGALATSGDARRFVMHEGRRLGHILDPRTGWPVEGAPRSITVLAATCLEAGTLATLAYLRGPGARAFLEQQGAPFWLF